MAVEIVDGGNASSTYTDTLDGGNAFTVYPAAGPDLVAVADGISVPAIRVGVTEVLPGTVAINLYRISDGRPALVRGGIRKYAVGGAAVVDWEAPFGVQVTYRAEMFSDAEATISLGFTDSSTTVLDVREAWFHQPLKPSIGFSPTMLWGTALERTRETPGDLVYPQGAEVATWVGGQRRGLSAVAFKLLTDTDGADQMQAVFGQYGTQASAVLCIRTPPAMRIPRTFYAAVSEVKETTLNRPGVDAAIQFDFTATEARPPAPGLVAALLRRMDINAAYSSRAAASAAYLTRLERESDYSLAGVGGDA